MSGILTRAGLRAFSTADLKVFNNVARQQFTISLKSDEAVLKYNEQGKNITFISTNVPPLFQGKGAGKLLADFAFTYALDKNLEVLCHCHFLCKFYTLNKDKYNPLKVILDPQEED